jgi:hypothetical protein
VPQPGGGPVHPGASASCSRLFEVTLHGPREEVPAERGTAATVRLADAAYAVQHAGDASSLPAALDRLGAALGARPAGSGTGRPAAWRTTIADVAADLDVIDLGTLVAAWARSVHEDCRPAPTARG